MKPPGPARAGAVAGSVDETAAGLGRDAAAYRRLLAPLVRDAGFTLPDILAPLRSVPSHPLAMVRFGLGGLLPASLLARRFRTPEAQALLAGAAAHANLPLPAPVSRALGLGLMINPPSLGWLGLEGGTARPIQRLASHLISLGGTLETG